MGSDVLAEVARGLIASLFTGLIVFVIAALFGLIAQWTRQIELRKKSDASHASYQNKMKSLVRDLLQASKQTDLLLNEITTVTSERQEALLSLEQRVTELSTRENTLQKRVEALKDEETSTAVAQYLAEQMDRSDRRSAWRDYLLFISGVFVSTVIAIVLKIAFGI